MRVYISSIPEEHEPHQAAACEVARALGFEVVLRDLDTERGLDSVRVCARQVAASDQVLAIVGWRRGPVPPPELGGDGLRPWVFWEVRSAFDSGKPVAVLMATESWPLEQREVSPQARAVMRDLRAELARLATVFDTEPSTSDGSRPLSAFRRLVRRKLSEAGSNSPTSGALEGLRLRRWPPPELPERPYPLLLPYTHPELLAGRERELDELRRQLHQPVPIVGLYGLAYRIGMLISFLFLPFNYYWSAQVYDAMKRPDGKTIYARLATYLLLFLSFAFVALTLGAGPALRFAAPPDYWPAAQFVGWVAFAYLLRSVGRYLRYAFSVLGRPETDAKLSWLSAALAESCSL